MLHCVSLLLLFFFNIVNGSCDDLLKTEEERLRHNQAKFDPALWEHDNLGCPENSLCTKEMGQHRKDWLNTLKKITKEKKDPIKTLESFQKENGIPLKFWTNYKSIDQFFPILWNSPCPNHNFISAKDEKNNIYEAISFVQALTQNEATLKVLKNQYKVPLGELFFLRPVYIQDEDEHHQIKIIKFLIPQGSVPSYFDAIKKQLITLMEEDEFFYAIGINDQGKIAILPYDKELAVKFSENIQCTISEIKNLKEQFIKENFPNRFFKDFFCKKIAKKNFKKNDKKENFVYLITASQC